MASESRDEVRELLGAYALDALDDDERAQVDRLIERDPQARAEVEAHRETAALLAHAGQDAPEGIWDRIAGALDADAPRLDLEAPRAARPSATRRAVGLRWVAAAAAVAVAVIGVLTVEAVRQNRRLDQLDAALGRDALARGAGAARSAPGSRTARLTTAAGAELANVVLRRDGTGYFVDEGMPVAPPGDTYQLWALVGDRAHPTAISAGVLGRRPAIAGLRIAAPVVGFAVTRERMPGVASSDQQPMVKGVLVRS